MIKQQAPTELTREKLADELTRLRGDYEQLRRETKTTRGTDIAAVSRA